MSQLLQLTGAKSNADLYKNVKLLEKYPPTDLSDNKLNQQIELIKSMHQQDYGKSYNTLSVNSSGTTKKALKNGDIPLAEGKLTFLFVNGKMNVADYTMVDKGVSASEMAQTMLKTKGANLIIIAAPTQSLDKNTIQNICKTADVMDKMNKKVMDVLAHGQDKTVSLGEMGFLINDLPPDFVRDVLPKEAVNFREHNVNEASIMPRQASIIDVDGYQDFVDYYANKELKNLNYIKDREKVDNLVACTLNQRYRERASMLMLDDQGDVLGLKVVAEGTENQAPILLDQIVATVLDDKQAQHIVFYHNHPSGRQEPSDADIRLTEELHETLKFFDKKLIDHSIVAKGNGVHSLQHAVPAMKAEYKALEKELNRQSELVM